jgi:L-glutamine-phosphate cytidylyltransferase
MKAIIVAAGQGTRLRPLTDTKPKCMVEYQGKAIIDSILETMVTCKISDIAIVNGYKKEVLETYLDNKNVTFFTNHAYATTNMVSTLFCAKTFMDDDLIISYADIVYDAKVLEKLISSQGALSVVVDRRWRELWAQRMENPLEDAETLKIVDGHIVELGKKPHSYEEIQGQYIGLIKISKGALKKVISFYESLDKNALYDGKDFNTMYMTSFIQLIIDHLMNVEPVFIDGGWVEVDCMSDLEIKVIR